MKSSVLDTLFTKNAAYLDIETLGTEVGVPTQEIGIYLPAQQRAVEFIPAPSSVEHVMGATGAFDPLRAKPHERTKVLYADWRQALSKYNNSWLTDRVKEGIYPQLEGKRVPSSRSAKFGGIEIPVTTIVGGDAGLRAKEAFDLMDNKVIWIANVPFEAKHLGLALQMSDQIDDVRKGFTYQAHSLHDFLLVSDPDVLKARMTGQMTGDWRSVWSAIKGVDLTKPGKKVFDIQDLIRSAQSFGQEISDTYKLGHNFSDVYRGTSLDIQAHIMGLPKEIHKGVEDDILSSIIGRKMGSHLEAMEGMLDRAHRGTGSGLANLSLEEKDALNWLHKMSTVKEVTAPIYARKAVGLALKDKVQAWMNNDVFRHRMSAGYEFATTKKVHEGRLIEAPMARPVFKDVYDFEEALDTIQGIKGNQGINVRAIASQMEDNIRGMAGPDALAYLERSIHSTGAEAAKAVRNHSLDPAPGYWEELGRAWPGEQPTRTKPPVTMSSKVNKGKAFYTRAGRIAGGIGLGILTIGALRGYSDTVDTIPAGDDNYNTIEGLNEDGYAAWLRKQNTDFGSGYQGLWDSMSLELAMRTGMSTPAYMNNVEINQEISDFRDFMMQTPLQKRIIESEVTKQSLKSLSSTYYLDPALTTPLASEDYSRFALNTRKNLQEINLSDVNWAVEDADTIIMKEGLRGAMGQSMTVRLAGIDAPEVGHSDEAMSMLRYKQEQPFGEEARLGLQQILQNAQDVRLVVDPTGDTYGRSLGVLVADGKNVNLELVRKGFAAALPFGESKDDLFSRNTILAAENQAYEGMKGMWQDNFWRTYKKSVSDNYRITNNTLARLDKLAGNMNIAALESTMELAQREGMTPAVYQSIGKLRPKLAKLGEKRDKKPYNPYVLNYHNTTMDYMDQLKIETQRHMTHYGNQIGDKRMGVQSHQISNQDFIIDSLTESMSIYRSKMPEILNKYNQDKVQKRRLQGQMQRMANKTMNTQSQNYHRM